MKRVIILLMSAVMLLGAASLASAVEFKASGHLMVLLGLQDNLTQSAYNKDRDEDNFYAAQRFRPRLTMKGEGVSAVVEVQAHQFIWGRDAAIGGSTNSPGVDLRFRNAYIDFKVPGTPVSVKAGFQQLALPAVWQHPIFHTRVGAVVATVPVSEQIAVAAFWARPDQAPISANVKAGYNSIDMFGLLAPLKFGNIAATPYFVYVRVGVDALANNIHENDRLLIAGANLNASIDALVLKADLIATKYDSDTSARDIGMGFMAALEAGYKLPFGTPALMAWYFSGRDKNGEDRFWTLGGDYTDGFSPTTLGYDGSSAWDIDNEWGVTGGSTMGIGVKVSDMSFIDSLKHTVRLIYVRGTDDDSLVSARDAWTEDDSLIEANFDSTWNMYENLAAIVEIGCMKPKIKNNSALEDDFGWRAQVNFNFKF